MYIGADVDDLGMGVDYMVADDGGGCRVSIPHSGKIAKHDKIKIEINNRKCENSVLIISNRLFFNCVRSPPSIDFKRLG